MKSNYIFLFLFISGGLFLSASDILASLGKRKRVSSSKEYSYRKKRRDIHPTVQIVYACMQNKHNAAYWAIKNGADVNFIFENKWTPLAIATKKGAFSIARLLIKNGAKVNLSGKIKKQTPLHFAFFNKQKEGKYQIAQYLIDSGADINAKDAEGRTPLFWSVVNHDDDGLELLLRAEADFREKNNKGESPFKVARTKYAKRVLAFLLGYSIKPSN